MTSSISLLVRIWKRRHSSPRCSFIWSLQVAYFPVKHSCPYNNTNYDNVQITMSLLTCNSWCSKSSIRHRIVSSMWSSLLRPSQRSFLIRLRESLFLNDAVLIINAIFKIEITSPNAGMMQKGSLFKKKTASWTTLSISKTKTLLPSRCTDLLTLTRRYHKFVIWQSSLFFIHPKRLCAHWLPFHKLFQCEKGINK